MTTQVIELNDSEIRVAEGDSIVLRSPGYAFLDKDKIEIGVLAARQARLQPRAVHNRYWKNLNQDPLQNPSTQARHNADLAFAQLLAIHEQSGKPDEVIIAVPGSFTNDQLALLLGLIDASPFTVVGLVDTAVAAITPTADKGNYVHVDMHLHQTVVTRLNVGEQVSRSSVQLVDGVGLTAIYDATAHLIADLFIKESRFDPQHHPETEQALYDQIPACLNSLQKLSEVTLEIQYQQTQHQAKLPLDLLLKVLNPLYEKITKLIDNSDSCLLSYQISQLPGLSALLDGSRNLAENSVFEACTLHAALFQSAGSASNYVTSLPAAENPIIDDIPKQVSQSSASASNIADNITHLLHGHNAYALNNELLFLSASGNISTNDAAASHCSIKQTNGQVELKIEGELAVFVNGRQLQQKETVQAGDIISFTGSKTEYIFIHVGS
jgi:hypothetical protein